MFATRERSLRSAWQSIVPNFEKLVPMKKIGEEDWAVTFEADAVLPAGDVYIQFRVESRIFDRPVELPDWRVEITP